MKGTFMDATLTNGTNTSNGNSANPAVAAAQPAGVAADPVAVPGQGQAPAPKVAPSLEAIKAARRSASPGTGAGTVGSTGNGQGMEAGSGTGDGTGTGSQTGTATGTNAQAGSSVQQPNVSGKGQAAEPSTGSPGTATASLP